MYNSPMDSDLGRVAKYFWDVDVSALSWEQNQNFIIRRILQTGDLESLRWLRARLGDTGMREWIVSHNARGLTPRQIRYWALILDIMPALADEWVETALATNWEQRR
jgi:hypothetical protein